MHDIVHYTVLFYNQAGYYNSLILQALELPPGQAKNGEHNSKGVFVHRFIVLQ